MVAVGTPLVFLADVRVGAVADIATHPGRSHVAGVGCIQLPGMDLVVALSALYFLVFGMHIVRKKYIPNG